MIGVVQVMIIYGDEREIVLIIIGDIILIL